MQEKGWLLMNRDKVVSSFRDTVLFCFYLKKNERELALPVGSQNVGRWIRKRTDFSCAR